MDSANKDKPYIVETTTIRLNHVASNDYMLAKDFNCRDCYIDGEEGEWEWQEYKAKQAEKREVWKNTIKDMLGVADSEGSFFITRSLS